jgi:hypothetical protein
MPLFHSLFMFLVESEVTSLNAVIAGLAFLNTLGIFGLIFHVGQYIGKNDQRWSEAEKRLAALDSAMTVIHNQEIMQAKLDLVVTGLKTTVEESKTEVRAEIQILRKRSHELASVIQQVLLKSKVQLQSQIELDETENKGG